MTGLNFSRIFLLATFFFSIFQFILSDVPERGWYSVFITDEGVASDPIPLGKDPFASGTGPNFQSNEKTPTIQDSLPKKVQAFDYSVTKYVAPDTATIIDALRGVTTFAGIFMEKLKNKFTAITPLGLYATLSLLKSLAVQNSPSANELKIVANVEPNVLQGINAYLKTLQVTSVNIFYKPTFSGGDLELHARDAIELSGTFVAGSQRQINEFVQKSTNGLVNELEIEDEEHIYFFNVLTLKFNWGTTFERLETTESFMNQKDIKFIATESPLKYHIGNAYTVVQLGFGNKDSEGNVERVKGVHSYMIQIKNDGPLTSKILNQVHALMEATPENELVFMMPSYKLEQKIDFDKTQFPVFLADENKDFKSIGSIGKVEMQQKTIICVDEFGATAIGITSVKLPTRSALFPEQIVFNSAFYHVIVEAESGAPLFIGHVTEANNNNC
ncbi:hypothetical protein HMI54_009553 [Coelomomyces lativittatus]|nr:hypothetical protein HMI56_006301 [Coelomomyces lativittatus]KAJ1518191.1 hypothetical protein HMI55_001878 [Coelomomyces lativittatus]KAJ1518726.1 hypothetical protein HMI54_009553 [Coelomomyces lativittatus]